MNSSAMRKTLTGATMIILAACSAGDSTAPAAGPNMSRLLANGEVAQALFSTAPADAPTTTLTLKASTGGTYYFGPHAVSVPDHAVCNPSTSGYGASYWNSSCTTLNTDFVVTVKWWTNAQGYPLVEFSPDIRFAPTKQVMIYLNEPGAAPKTSSAILYCPTGASVCTNESASDPTLATWRDPVSGWLWRIVRHFSGYNVWA